MAGDWLLPLGHCHPTIVQATDQSRPNPTQLSSAAHALADQVHQWIEVKTSSGSRLLRALMT
jgi:hypothetical protein